MIELISESRCTSCNICVRVCPTNVFDQVPGEAPVIARQSDCQTCFMCELYCPSDALFVAADVAIPTAVDEARLERDGVLGSYRRAIGWTPETRERRGKDLSFQLTQPH
jgi:NAD-dependent dihydropyrimidine dehydrogenase PreA subunit